MQAAVNLSAEGHGRRCHRAGRHLWASATCWLSAIFRTTWNHLRRAFDLFEQKTQILRLLDFSSKAEGVRIFIGGESQVVPLQELSVVSAPYEVDGKVVGTLGVIGPTRMPYDKVIQIVDITSKLVSNALSHHR